MTTATVLNSSGSGFTVTNAVLNSAGATFNVDNDVLNSSGAGFTIFAAAGPATPVSTMSTHIHVVAAKTRVHTK